MKKRTALFFLVFFMAAAAFADAITGAVTAHSWLLNIADIFSQKWVRVLFCLLLIGQAFGIIISSGQNQQITKTLIATLIATGIFLIAGVLVKKGFTPSVRFGLRNFSKFNVTKLWDKPLVMGMEDFFAMLYGLQSFVITLVTLACFLNIAFNCFKVWAGTQELKKLYVDVIYKSFLCILLMNFYPALQTGAFQLATEIGGKASGGIDRLNNTFVTAVKYLNQECKEKMKAILPKILEKGTLTSADGEKYIDTSTLSILTRKYYVSQEEIEQLLQKNNIKRAYASMVLKTETVAKETVTSNGYRYTTYEKTGTSTGTTTGEIDYRDMNGNKIEPKQWNWFSRDDARDKTNAGKKVIRDETKDVEKAFNKLLALSEIMTGYSLTEMSEWDETERDRRLRQMFEETDNLSYSPWLADKNGDQSQILAPSSLVKTTLLLADALAMSEAYGDGTSKGEQNKDAKVDGDYNATENVMNEDFANEDDGKNQKKFFDKGTMIWNGFKGLLVCLFYWIAGMGCTILAIVEYTMAVWEYALVTSLATLLIPFLFLDATKSFATNIIKIFLQYFAKIMVVTIATFYTLNMFISTALYCYATSANTSALTCIGVYVFAMILGVVFIAGSEKIANILFTGTPQLSMGDIVQGARDVGMAAHAVGGAAKFGANAIGGAAKTAQGTVRGVQSAAAFGSGLRQAGQSARDAVTSSVGFTNDAQGQKMASQAAGSAKRAYVGAALGQGLKDAATKLFTGRDAQHFDEKGKTPSSIHSFQGVGGKYLDEQGVERGTTTYKRAKDAAHSVASEIGKNAAEKLINPSQKADQSMQKDSEKPDSGVDHLTKSPGS